MMCFGVYIYIHIYSRYALCLLLKILLVAALDIKTRDAATVSSTNSLLSQYCKPSFFFVAIFYVPAGGGGGGARRQRVALPRLPHGQRPALSKGVHTGTYCKY
jgi:hypothetical protein